MTCELESPDFDLRREVLRQRASQDGLDIPAEVLEYIAANVTDSIRELEGIVVSLLPMLPCSTVRLQSTLAQSVLNNAVKIQKKDCEFRHRYPESLRLLQHRFLEKLFTKSRKREISDARQMVMYLAKRRVKMPVTAIGTRLSRSHATVLHALKNIEERMSLEAALRLGYRENRSIAYSHSGIRSITKQYTEGWSCPPQCSGVSEMIHPFVF